MSGSDGSVLGPIDYLVLRVPEPTFSGALAAAVIDLIASGTVRVLDLAVLHKGADGSVSGTPLEDLPSEQAGRLAGLAPYMAGLLSREDYDQAGEALDPGDWAGLLVWENTWAEPFVAAVIKEGGQVVASGRVAATDLNDALERAPGA